MLGNLKNKFWSLQEEISSSVRHLTPSQVPVAEACEYDGVNRYAGGNLLEAWQVRWEELHRVHERNARKAAKCDKTIDKINHNVESQWKNVMTLQNLGKVQKALVLVMLVRKNKYIPTITQLFCKLV